MLYALELLPQCPAQLCPALPVGGPALTSGIAGLDTVVNQGTEPQPGSKTAPFCCYCIPITRRHRRHLEISPRPQAIRAKLPKDLSPLNSWEGESRGDGPGTLATAGTWLLLLRPRSGAGDSLFRGTIPG